jgi:3-hydroxyacyl-CoA dehydrogenase/enoyl-CoA hydratase/3-hydroxybutyryl-CoA epimerase
MNVSVQDREQKFIDPAFERAGKLFGKRLKAPGAAAAALERMRADVPGDGVADAQVIIEAIVEKSDVKRDVFARIEENAPPDAILATNTSSIRIEDIADALQEPGRLVGIHFFNPVAALPLVEIVSGASTDADTASRAMAFVTQIGKLPLPCRSAPGFVVNRVLMPYMIEALRAHEEGVPLETIDRAARRFGMPMGPIELADRVGLDVALHVTEILSQAFGGEPPASLRSKVEGGFLGTKAASGGFYRYENDRPVRNEVTAPPHPDLEDRLILSLVNECVACLSEGVVADADLLDAGVVFGTGFAPFTGGPLHYARTRGVTQVTERLSELASRYGDRFLPHEGWAEFRAES